MLYNEREIRDVQALDIAQKMLVAARTAPKAKGVDIVACAVIDGETRFELAAEMPRVAEGRGLKFFVRDAGNIEASSCVLLVGTAELAQGLNCGHCGYERCADRASGVPCAINSLDVGIALGAACAKAADYRVDTRVLFSAGFAAQRLGYLGECKQVYAIPVSVSSKSPFFDRPAMA